MKKSSSTAAPESTGPSESAPAKRTRKRKNCGPDVRVVMDAGNIPAALVHSLSDQAAIESVTGKHTARIVSTMEALNLAKDHGLSITETGAE